ncbi:hypothetical protein DYB26_004012 [Aphanomyces astaci]|uniref:Serine aminopeptidase S33 domain-containing protein n=1 Tax=Aphanomyces astaci TaxID=112090 RepID=A0A3R6XMN7_APHAT|nr:hypothetical protein DYB26_004012 [Aphanomyces astaci]
MHMHPSSSSSILHLPSIDVLWRYYYHQVSPHILSRSDRGQQTGLTQAYSLGCSQDMREFCHAATSSGYRAVVFNKRGHGQSKLTTPRLQAFGCTSDMKAVLAHVQSTFPGVPVVGTTCPFNFNDDEAASRVGVGYSAGAGLLSSYLGEMGQHSKLAAGVLVSPGIAMLTDGQLDLYA